MKERLESNYPAWARFILDINRFKIDSDEFKPLFFYYAVALYEEIREYEEAKELSEFGDVLVFTYLLFWLADYHNIPYQLGDAGELTLNACLRFYRGDNDQRYIGEILSSAKCFVESQLKEDEKLLEEAIESNLVKLQKRVKLHGSVMKDK